MLQSGKFYESEYEEATIKKLEALGWNYTFGYHLNRKNTDILIEDDLKKYIQNRYNEEELTEEEINTIIGNIKNINENSLYSTLRKRFTTYRDGFALSRNNKSDINIEYIDFDNPHENNIFRVVNQFEVGHGQAGETKRPDILLFINGIPVCIFELKNPTDYSATIHSAYEQIHNRYKTYIPHLISYTAISVISDGSNTRLGTPFTPYEYYYAWKKINNEDDAARPGIPELDTMIKGVFEPSRLLEILIDFVYFPDIKSEKEYEIICRYPQFFATNKLLESILTNSKANGGDGKGGTYFGATGCGKTYTMIFLARQLARKKLIGSPTIVVIVDRDDLQDQTGKLFINSSDFLNCSEVEVINSRKTLKEKLRNKPSGGAYICTIQKFEEGIGLLSDRNNIICFSDEAHRSQTNLGQKLRIVTEPTDNKGKKINMGAFISYGYATYLRKSFPNATYVGFTGTPIDETTYVFGGIVDKYTMKQSVNDGITVGIKYAPRLARVMTNEMVKKIEEYYAKCYEEGAKAEDIEKSKKAMSSMSVILGDEERLKRLASDIYLNYENICLENPKQPMKAMITCSSREIAFKLYKIFQNIAPDWFEKQLSPYQKWMDDGELKDDEIKMLKPMETLHVICDRAANDPTEMAETFGTKKRQKDLASKFKNPYTNFRVVIVVDMWVTGFDCPSLTILYNDKPLQKHNLVQTISRVNRKFKEKEFGLIVDYIGIRENMRQAMKQYGGDYQAISEDDVQTALEIYRKELQILKEMMSGFDLSPFFKEKEIKRLETIQNAAEYIMGNTQTFNGGNGKKVSFITVFKNHIKNLRSASSLCSPAGVLSEEESAWGQMLMGICSYIGKMTSSQHDTYTMNAHVEQMVAEALTVGSVETVYEDVLKMEDIWSEKFLQDLEEVKLPNTKFQILVKQLKKAIKEYSKVNRIGAKKFEDMLNATVDEYNNRDNLTFVSQVAGETLDGVQDIVENKVSTLTERLTTLLGELKTEKESFKKLGITFEEKAFYDVLTTIRDKYEFEYPDEQCISLAKKIKELVDDTTVYANWKENDNLKNKLNYELNILLYKNGYPPEWNRQVYEKILEQVENYKENE